MLGSLSELSVTGVGGTYSYTCGCTDASPFSHAHWNLYVLSVIFIGLSTKMDILEMCCLLRLALMAGFAPVSFMQQWNSTSLMMKNETGSQ